MTYILITLSVGEKPTRWPYLRNSLYEIRDMCQQEEENCTRYEICVNKRKKTITTNPKTPSSVNG